MRVLCILLLISGCAVQKNDESSLFVGKRTTASKLNFVEKTYILNEFQEKLFAIYCYTLLAEHTSSSNHKTAAAKYQSQLEKELVALAKGSPYMHQINNLVLKQSQESSIKAFAFKNLASKLMLDATESVAFNQSEIELQYQLLKSDPLFKVYQANVEHLAHIAKLRSK